MPDASPAEDPNAALASVVAEVIEANQAARAELMEAVDALAPERRRETWYGEWSIHDILAHLYEWQDGFAHALERMARGERPEIPDYNPEDSDDVFNAMTTARHRDRTWEDLLTRMRAARERHEAAVRNLVGRIPPDRFEEGRTARRLADSAEHDREHIPAILAWRREQGI